MFPIEVTVNHVPTRDGGRIFAFVTDITERQRAAAALQERTAELEYRTTQLSQMAWDLTLAEHHAREQIARMLHDGLQQLLVIVALNLERQLKRENERGGPPSELLAEAKHQLGEAMAVARSLNVELFPPVLQRSGLPAALKWLAAWTRDKYKVTVQISADPRADSTRKDVRTLLFESVRELLFNAVKYAQTDRVTLALELDAEDQLCITVIDRGVGFEPARLDDRSKSGQVGWGLFRIRERLTLLGGRLDIDSAPGRGTRIQLVAPRDAAHDILADGNEMRPAPLGAASTVDVERAAPNALRILIVDDHPPVRRALREMLHQRPELSVVGDASNGFDAIAHAHALRPDVVLMDVSMPHMDGVEATARIRRELPDIRIVGVSTLARNETADAIEQAGAAEFFVKGADTQRLIDHLLAFHASRQAGVRAHRRQDTRGRTQEDSRTDAEPWTRNPGLTRSLPALPPIVRCKCPSIDGRDDGPAGVHRLDRRQVVGGGCGHARELTAIGREEDEAGAADDPADGRRWRAAVQETLHRRRDRDGFPGHAIGGLLEHICRENSPLHGP